MYSSEIFYTKFVNQYSDYSQIRYKYISAVNSFIANQAKLFSTIIDVGSGDGKRSKKIADFVKATKLTLLDNSEGMIGIARKLDGVSVIYSDIASSKIQLNGKYKIVMCLWNVLGHISTNEKRKIAMLNMKNLMDIGGIIFLDVNNRYNIAQYGLKNVIKNICRDIFLPQKTNGDFEISFNIGSDYIKTMVHIFSPFEINKLIKQAGLKVMERKIINYKTGEFCHSIFGGQLVYKISKA